jgi:Ferric reductase like transmembrane component
MWYKDSLRTKPKWLRVCLSVRKHVGLLSLWMLLIHIIGSCIFFNEAYLKKFFEEPTAYSSKLNWMGELSFACGVWGTGLYTIMGVASMPNVASEMTNKQFKFIFGPIAWIALTLGTVHTMVQGVQEVSI